MINLRYHIVSITAVFLALGIGLAFGASFVDRSIVNALNDNLEAVERQNVRLEAENAHVAAQLRVLDEMEAAVLEQGVAQLVAGRLAGVPVVFLAVRGIDENSVNLARDAVVASGADFGGILWLTDRLVLDDESEVGDLAAALAVDSTDPDELRAVLTRRLGAVLADAAQSAPVEPPVVVGATTTSTLVGTPRPVPELIQALLSGQFLELDGPDPAPTGFALLPDAGARYVVVSGPGASVPDIELLVPLLSAITADPPSGAARPVVVAAQPGPRFDPDPPDGSDPAAERVVFVGLLRSDETLRDRLSTVDDLEFFAGLIAGVLALEDGPSGQFGHYGIGAGAQSLLPAPPEPVPGG